MKQDGDAATELVRTFSLATSLERRIWEVIVTVDKLLVPTHARRPSLACFNSCTTAVHNNVETCHTSQISTCAQAKSCASFYAQPHIIDLLLYEQWHEQCSAYHVKGREGRITDRKSWGEYSQREKSWEGQGGRCLSWPRGLTSLLYSLLLYSTLHLYSTPLFYSTTLTSTILFYSTYLLNTTLLYSSTLLQYSTLLIYSTPKYNVHSTSEVFPS